MRCSKSMLRTPTLVFAPAAWLKLQYFCHRGDTEVGGFGVTAPGRPLYIEEFVTLPQDTSSVTVAFRDDAVADFFDRCVDRKMGPERFARIWLHSHPGASVAPSATDETTFARVFGGCDWAVMAILGRTANTYARLSYSIGPQADLEIAVAVDWAGWPSAYADGPSLDRQIEQWAAEYAANIHPRADFIDTPVAHADDPFFATDRPWPDDRWLEIPDYDDFSQPYGDPHERLAAIG